jgi:hypothetical protein
LIYLFMYPLAAEATVSSVWKSYCTSLGASAGSPLISKQQKRLCEVWKLIESICDVCDAQAGDGGGWSLKAARRRKNQAEMEAAVSSGTQKEFDVSRFSMPK